MMEATTECARPALRYHGSKWRLAPWIISTFPQHQCYVEPFGGGAAVLLQKPRSWLEVYNDLDEQVVNYFRVLRSRKDDLIRAIRWTPYSQREWELSMEDDPDPVERARRFYIRSFQGIAGPTAQWRTGWRRQKVVTEEDGKKRMTPACQSWALTDHLYDIAERLRGVQIDCLAALEAITRYDSRDTLFYLDPPYPEQTRCRWKQKAYAYEMTEDQHIELSRAVHQVAGMVIISSYPSDLYNELYADWAWVTTQARTNSQTGVATEMLWLSPNACRPLPLFEWAKEKEG